MQPTHLLTVAFNSSHGLQRLNSSGGVKKALSNKPPSNRRQMGQKDCSNIEVQQNSTTLKKSVSENVNNKEAKGDIPCHRIV